MRRYVPMTILWLCLWVGLPDTQAQIGADWGEDQYAIAAQHYRQQRWTQAIGQFEILLERAPEHPRAALAHFFLAESHVQLEQFAASVPQFEAFLERDPAHPLATRAHFRLGEAFYLLGRDEASIDQLKKLLPLDQERQYTEFIWAYLGEMLLRQDTVSSTEEARDYLQQVLRDYPASSLAERSTLALAQAYQRLNDPQAAEAMLVRLRAGQDPAVAQEALLALASLWMERGQWQAVVEALDDATVENLSPRLQPRAQYWRGRGEMARQNWQPAAAHLEASLESLSDPRLAQAATYDAAICHWQAEDLGSAQRLWLTGLEKWPDGTWAAESQFLLVQAALRLQSPALITERATAFLDRFPAHALAGQVREILGRRALAAGDYAKAETLFRGLIRPEIGETTAADPPEVAAADPPTESTRATWNYLWGLALLGLERFEPSLQALDDCLALLPPVPPPSDPATSLEVWLLEPAQSSRGAPDSGDSADRGAPLREQAQYARATALARLQRWPAALAAQAEILIARPRSPYRFELWADRLRILAGTAAWDDYEAAVEVAQQWLAQKTETETETTAAAAVAAAVAAAAVTPEGVDEAQLPPDSKAQAMLSKAVAATALVAADHWYATADYGRARSWYELAAQAEDPAVAESALSGLAWAEFHTLPTADAERTAQLLLDRFVDSPRSAEVGLKLAQQLYRDGRLIPAGEWVQTLLDRFPNWPRRHQLSALQAKIWGQMSDTTAKQQAVAALETALRDLERLSGDDEATGSGRSRDDWKAVYLYELAWLEQELGQSQRAEERFAAIQLGHPTSRYWADATFRLAQSHFRQGRLTQAAELLEQIVQADHTADDPVSDVPASGGVPARTVSQSRVVGEGAAANTAAPVAAEILCQTLYLRAMVSASEKDWPAVATLSERLVTEFPAHRLRWLAQYWWGEACFRLQRFPQAIELLTAILPRTDAQADSWVAMSHLRLAQSYGHLDRWREALHVAEPARRRFTDFAQLYELDYLIGRALATEGQFPQSRVAYQQVIDSPTGRATETAAMAQWMIGETYFHQEQYALAAEAYHRTETLYPFPQWQAAALYQAGQCYEQLRRDRDAENVYRQLLREHAQCSLAARAQERLEQLSTRLEIEAPRPPQAAGGSR